MKEILKAVGCAIFGVVAYKYIHDKGYNKGVDECKRMTQLAVDVKEAVENKEEES